MTPCPSDEILNEFLPFAFQCRPEAPWIKRCGNGIKFTEEIEDDSRIQLIHDSNSLYNLIEDKYIYMPTKEQAKFRIKECKLKTKANSMSTIISPAQLT